MRWPKTKHAIHISYCSTHLEFHPKSAVTEALLPLTEIFFPFSGLQNGNSVRDENKQSLTDGAAAPGSSDPAFRRKGADDPCPTEASPSPTRRGPPGPDNESVYE